ncbi:hypothetical protein NKI25_30145 [Mesorhizobium sp. M0808]|uniref:hypothetical protein n=1 Tax=unclassified Mesorhizobium TaxID=325217 RepID=UPI00333A95A2
MICFKVTALKKEALSIDWGLMSGFDSDAVPPGSQSDFHLQSLVTARARTVSARGKARIPPSMRGHLNSNPATHTAWPRSTMETDVAPSFYPDLSSWPDME